MSTATSTATATPPAAKPARTVKLYRNRQLGPAKREVFAAVTTAAHAGELSTKEAKHAFVQLWAEKHTRSEGTVRYWLREALAGLALVDKADPTPEDLQDKLAPKPIEPDLLSGVEAKPAPVEEGTGPVTLRLVRAEGWGAASAVAMPAHELAGDREAWWEVRSLKTCFGAAFDLSRCQVPHHARMEAVTPMADAPDHRFMVVELMRTDAVMLVLACNRVDVGAVHWFGRLVQQEYEDRFAMDAQMRREAVHKLALPSGAELPLIMWSGGARIDAGATFAAFFNGDELAHERFGIAPELRPNDLFLQLMPVLGQAALVDRGPLGELVKWLGATALPEVASLDRAAGIEGA